MLGWQWQKVSSPLESFVAYLDNHAFPQPLSEQEESLYIKLFLETGDSEARNILIEHNLRLVAHITKKFEACGESMEDLISIGTIGLIKAINTYDQTRGTKLATYASRCIENEILMYLRANKKTKGEVSIYDSIGIDKEGNEITLIDVLGTEGDVVVETVENTLDRKQVRSKLKNLTKRERRVLEMRYGLIDSRRHTQKDVAKNLGISRSYVSRIEKRAVNRLLKELEKG